jgi:ATP/maltotriose-dependent transcriptional regulator MalT
LRATLDWSFDLLEINERVLLAQLGVFVGGFDLEAVEAVAGHDLDSLEGLTKLLEHSLVVKLEAERFTLLEPVREYALEKLEPEKHLGLQQAHATHFLRLSDRARTGLTSFDQATWLDRLEREHPNILVAMQHGLETGQPETVVRFAWNLWWFWLIRVNFEARPLIQAALEPQQHLSGANQARALSVLAALEFRSGSIELSHAQKAAQLSREAHDQPGEAFALFTVALAHLMTGQMTEALLLMQEALSLSRASQEMWLTANILQNIGGITFVGGDLETARNMGEEARQIATQLGDSSLIAWNRLGSSQAYLQAGCIELAVSEISEALRLARTVRDAAITASCLEAFAAVAACIKDDARAARLWGIADHFRGATAAAPSIDRQMFEPFVQPVKERLEPTRFNAERARGATMTLEAALEEALQIGVTMPRDPLTDLTRRELEVLRLLAQGLPDKKIALELSIGLETAKTHVRSIFSKLGVPNRVAAARHALKHGLA